MNNLETKLKNPRVKIDLGCGSENKKQPFDEWIHLDGREIEGIDLVCEFNNIPLSDECADEIFSGDTIEHLIMEERDKVLREWNRVTKVGGIFTGRCPNLHATMIRYAKGELSLKDATGALYGSQENKWQQHYITYTVETLRALLEQYGFGCIDFSESPGSYDPNESWWLCWTCQKIKNL